MSDAIGGSGGGKMDPMAMIGGLLDPMGLLGGLVGGIGKLLQGDMSGIADIGKGAMNKVGAFDPTAMGGPGAPGQSGDATVYWTGDDKNASDGYSNDDAGQDPDDVEQNNVSQNSQTDNSGEETQGASQSQTGDQRTQSTSAMTADQSASQNDLAQKEAELAVLQTIKNNFGTFDQDWLFHKNGLINETDLRFIANAPLGVVTDTVRNAAKYLLDHPKLLADLIDASGTGGGTISHAIIGVKEVILKGEITRAKAAGAGGPGQNNAGGANNTNTNNTNTNNNGGGGATNVGGGQTPNGNVGIHPDPTTTSGQPGDKTFNGMIARLDARLDSLQSEIEAQIKVLEDPKASESAVRIAQTKLTQLNQKMQTIMEQRKAMFELISNISKTFADMQMAAIRNIR